HPYTTLFRSLDRPNAVRAGPWCWDYGQQTIRLTPHRAGRGVGYAPPLDPSPLSHAGQWSWATSCAWFSAAARACFLVAAALRAASRRRALTASASRMTRRLASVSSSVPVVWCSGPSARSSTSTRRVSASSRRPLFSCSACWTLSAATLAWAAAISSARVDMIAPSGRRGIGPQVGDALLDRPVVDRPVLAQDEEVPGTPLGHDRDRDSRNTHAVLLGDSGVLGEQLTGEELVLALHDLAKTSSVEHGAGVSADVALGGESLAAECVAHRPSSVGSNGSMANISATYGAMASRSTSICRSAFERACDQNRARGRGSPTSSNASRRSASGREADNHGMWMISWRCAMTMPLLMRSRRSASATRPSSSSTASRRSK